MACINTLPPDFSCQLSITVDDVLTAKLTNDKGGKNINAAVLVRQAQMTFSVAVMV